MQCKDIPDVVVLRHAANWRAMPKHCSPVIEALKHTYPEAPGKLLYRKVCHLVDRGLMEYGTSPYTAWPTPEGEGILERVEAC